MIDLHNFNKSKVLSIDMKVLKFSFTLLFTEIVASKGIINNYLAILYNIENLSHFVFLIMNSNELLSL